MISPFTRCCFHCSPTPRCAHQAIIHKSVMYVFGGEVTSPNQERFHHYKVRTHTTRYITHNASPDTVLPLQRTHLTAHSRSVPPTRPASPCMLTPCLTSQRPVSHSHSASYRLSTPCSTPLQTK